VSIFAAGWGTKKKIAGLKAARCYLKSASRQAHRSFFLQGKKDTTPKLAEEVLRHQKRQSLDKPTVKEMGMVAKKKPQHGFRAAEEDSVAPWRGKTKKTRDASQTGVAKDPIQRGRGKKTSPTTTRRATKRDP